MKPKPNTNTKIILKDYPLICQNHLQHEKVVEAKQPFELLFIFS